MKLRTLFKCLALLVLTAALGAGNGFGQMLGNLFNMIGGMDTVGKLSSSVLKSSASDPRLTGVLGKLDVNAASPKLADQMCSMLGGSCKAPLTDQQLAAGASKLDETQTRALGDNFSSALKGVTDNPLVKEGVSKVIGPKLAGIVGALL